MEHSMDKMIREFFEKLVMIEFDNFIDKHYNSLKTKAEQDSFNSLIKDKEYSLQIIQRLYIDFEREIMTDEKMESLLDKAYEFTAMTIMKE